MSNLISVNTLCLEQGTLVDHVAAISRLGVPGIGVTIDEVLEAGPATARDILRAAGLTAATMTHRAVVFAPAEEALRGRERLMRSIEIAHRIGALSLTITTGGRLDMSWPQAAERFIETIRPCAQAARDAGVALALEPTSHLYADASIVHRLTDLVALARRADINLGIDIFACWFDSDIDEAIVAAAPLCRLVQVSDYIPGDRGLPCRAVPGDGMIPLERLLPAIAAAGYDGWFDIEVIGPRLAQERIESGLARSVSQVRAILAH